LYQNLALLHTFLAQSNSKSEALSIVMKRDEDTNDMKGHVKSNAFTDFIDELSADEELEVISEDEKQTSSTNTNRASTAIETKQPVKAEVLKEITYECDPVLKLKTIERITDWDARLKNYKPQSVCKLINVPDHA
jgi:hypothetical protein